MYLEGSRWVNTAVRFVYVIALTHYLGPELYGLLNYGMSWYLAFLPFTILGMGAILGTEIGRDRGGGARIASLTLTLRIFSSGIAAVACGILGWLCESKPEARILLGVFSVGLGGRSLAVWVGSIFNAYELNK
jgi:O-antigen/teichoic acid export membrane protein